MEMTELSPTAEAILEAFANRTLCGRDGDSEFAPALASALRVVADHISNNEVSGGPYALGVMDGLAIASKEILTLASELEAYDV